MSFSDDLLQVDTPENVAFGYPVAGIGSRFIAALVDTALLVLLQIAVFSLGALLAARVFDVSADDVTGGASAWVIAGLGLVSFLFLWGYYIFFELLWNGQSPGKRWTGLRVIRSDGRPITLSESVIRNLVRLVDFLPSLYGAGIVIMFLDPQARRLGDLAAGTIVVREGRGATGLEALLEEKAPAQAGPVRLTGYGELPLGMLSGVELELIDSFLDRRNLFSNPDVIASQVLARLFARMELEAPDLHPWTANQLLVDIRSALSHKDL